MRGKTSLANKNDKVFCGNIKLNYCMQFKNQQKLTAVAAKSQPTTTSGLPKNLSK